MPGFWRLNQILVLGWPALHLLSCLPRFVCIISVSPSQPQNRDSQAVRVGKYLDANHADVPQELRELHRKEWGKVTTDATSANKMLPQTLKRHLNPISELAFKQPHGVADQIVSI